MVLFPIYSRGLNQPFYIIFNCSCSEFHPLIYLSVVPPVFFSQTHPLSRLADKFLMLVGRCIPRDTRRYGIAFPPISFYILLSRLLVERIVALKIQSQLNVRCFVSAVHRSSTSVDEASTRADWTPPPSAFNSPSVSQLESCSKYTIRMNFFMRSTSDRWPHVATSRADPGNVRQRHMSMCPPMPFVRVLL